MKAYLVTYKAYISSVEYRTALVYAANEVEALAKTQDGEEEDTIDYETGDSETNDLSFERAEVVVAPEGYQTEMIPRLRERGIPIEEDANFNWPVDKIEVKL